VAGEKLGLRMAKEPVNTDIFAHLSALPGPYKKILQIRSVSGRLQTNIYEKCGAEDNISIYMVNITFSKFLTF
jgi:hypothetical protein